MTNPIKSTQLSQEQLLWNHFRAGDEVAFTQLSKQYYKTLVHYGRKFTSNNQIIEDAIQDLLIKLWIRRASLNEVESVKFYLLRAFRNQLFKTLQLFKAVPLEDDFNDIHVEDSSEISFIAEESSNSINSKVSSSLKQLPERQREILYLRFYQDLRVEEIAQLLQIKPQSVSNTIQRALATIRENWELVLLLFCWFTF
ncbi:sigma-70 family RNA polymerase sigma factor [Arcicella aquatica]|uniref:Sigma-70 family RNA polymerase sigma factor n=1 Tax=Arcicella aquatica TaxID=217141 RepID=A0ABU5QHZ6_9BACT|nr:sigma-70 family RNA polymerase sigma factor [Arcicella aquatica]MEA5256678.1 sigma-70 family RNA polymerase sigma factor [Arcicella aquatica]